MAYTKEEREKNKSILLATLNYFLEFHSDDIIFDDYNPAKEGFLAEIKRTESDIKKYRSKEIKNRLDRYIERARYRCDVAFNNYIKENTGYDINLFESFKASVIPITSKESIDVSDIYPIENYLRAYGSQPDEQERAVRLKGLLAEYEAEVSNLISSGEAITFEGHVVWDGKRSRTMNANEYRTYIKEWQLSEEISPNGSCKLRVEVSGEGECASTYVVISLRGGSGAIYSARGERLPIKAHWKDDNHIMIETKKEYESSMSYKQVSSYGEVFKIEYCFV